MDPSIEMLEGPEVFNESHKQIPLCSIFKLHFENLNLEHFVFKGSFNNLYVKKFGPFQENVWEGLKFVMWSPKKFNI